MIIALFVYFMLNAFITGFGYRDLETENWLSKYVIICLYILFGVFFLAYVIIQTLINDNDEQSE